MTASDYAAWWGAIVATLVLGWDIFGRLKENNDRNQRVKGHLGALRAELAENHKYGETYLRDKVKSPLYRLPTVIYEAALPALLADSALDEIKVGALVAYYGMVETLNRGLDEADRVRAGQHSSGSSPEAALDDAYGRNLLKAKQLVNELYKPAAVAIGIPATV